MPGARSSTSEGVCGPINVIARSSCDEAIHSFFTRSDGLLRFARNDGPSSYYDECWQYRETHMAEKQFDRSRRKVIHAVATGVSAGLLFRISQTKASDKMTRQQAQYQDTPNGIYSCGLCTLFERPNACKVVEGEVSKDGWCKAYAMAD